MAGGDKALLIGVQTYTSEAIRDLPFVANDLATMREMLGTKGYHVETWESPGIVSLAFRVQDFLDRADADDRLIIYLNGHGFHIGGHDYLAATDAEPRLDNFRTGCLQITESVRPDRTSARQVVVIVDACREGFTFDTKRLTGRWSVEMRSRSADQNVVFLFGCGAGEVAQFVEGPDGYSLFTKALVDVLTPDTGPSEITAVTDATRRRLHELTGQLGRNRQTADSSGRLGQHLHLFAEAGPDAVRVDPVLPSARRRWLWLALAGVAVAVAMAAGAVVLPKVLPGLTRSGPQPTALPSATTGAGRSAVSGPVDLSRDQRFNINGVQSSTIIDGKERRDGALYSATTSVQTLTRTFGKEISAVSLTVGVTQRSADASTIAFSLVNTANRSQVSTVTVRPDHAETLTLKTSQSKEVDITFRGSVACCVTGYLSNLQVTYADGTARTEGLAPSGDGSLTTSTGTSSAQSTNPAQTASMGGGTGADRPFEQWIQFEVDPAGVDTVQQNFDIDRRELGTFKAILLAEGTRNASRVTVDIRVGDRSLRKYELTMNELVPVELDLGGSTVLRIVVTATPDECCATVYVGDPLLSLQQ